MIIPATAVEARAILGAMAIIAPRWDFWSCAGIGAAELRERHRIAPPALE